ncbi:hypothetical protein [Variovorax sp.]|uniref:hypothetical protein n=1 Tax=Variovorax sp. TaxID=1871043 RepID=UPI004037A1CC
MAAPTQAATPVGGVVQTIEDQFAAWQARRLPPLFLHFTEWQCGHHCERPADIPVASAEQALAIASAISHAISQPGHANAVVMSADRAETIYITDDHVEMGYQYGANAKPRDYYEWPERPVVIVGAEPDLDAILSDELHEAREALFGAVITRFNPLDTLYGYDVAVSYLPQAELEEKAAPKDAYEERHVPFDLPPVFRNAAEVLEALRQEAADQAAYQLEIAQETACFCRPTAGDAS